MAISQSDSTRTNAPKPTDDKYGPYPSLAAAKAGVPVVQRYDGCTVKVTGDGEYWWKDPDFSDAGLIPKGGDTVYIPLSGTTPGNPVTGELDFEVNATLDFLDPQTDFHARVYALDGLCVDIVDDPFNPTTLYRYGFGNYFRAPGISLVDGVNDGTLTYSGTSGLRLNGQRVGGTVYVTTTTLTFTQDAVYPFISSGSWTVDPTGRQPGVVVSVTLGVGVTVPTLDPTVFTQVPNSGTYTAGREHLVMFQVSGDSRVLYLVKPTT